MEGDKQLAEKFWENYSLQQGKSEKEAINLAAGPRINRSLFKERIVAGAIVVASLIAVFAVFFQISNINNSSLTNRLASAENANINQENYGLLALKAKDTDGDGLSDYDELNKYGTSPYLEDTDSDGYLDKAEIDLGYDPNCAGKESCFSQGNGNTNASVPTLQTEPDTAPGKISGELLRSIFRQSGMSEEDLSQLSDAELFAMYQEAISESGSAGGSGSSNINASATGEPADLSGLNISSVADLRNLTAAQIRALLVEQGAPESLLNQVSDEELKNMFLEKLDEKIKTTP